MKIIRLNLAFTGVCNMHEMFMKLYSLLVISLGLWAALHCSSPLNLSREETEKLDRPLQRLVRGEHINDADYSMYTTEDGIKKYGIIMYASDPDPVRQAGIEINSVSGEIITAKVSIAEIRKLVLLPAVTSIRNASKTSVK
jgi:hypothetical protein